MSDRTTINVSKDAHRKASDAKREDESWSDYITRCIDAEADVSNGGVDSEKIDALITETEQLKRAVKENTELVNRMMRQFEEQLR